MIDWELAIFLDDKCDANVSQRQDRAGTWQFMSAALLRGSGRLHGFKDSIESFVHVLGWTVLSYLPILIARYGEPPTEDEKETLEFPNALVLKGQLDEEVLYTQPAYRYQLGVERLSSSKWFLRTVQNALERPGRPAKDGAGDRLIEIIDGTTRQRQRAARRIKTETQILSAFSGPLKRSNTSPPPTPQD
ncbi:hypothetical protein EDD16DRAFT_1891683 [Pisolithus croceorrhizus]|nr:hypothetical protein EDD16DRAFT_1891683 [Pisolithus croceorrhizus]